MKKMPLPKKQLTSSLKKHRRWSQDHKADR
jgi:hypothetical protein